MKRYSVFFHRGDELTLKTRVMKGRAWVDDAGLHIESKEALKLGPPAIPLWEGGGGFTIPRQDISEAELFRLHGLGRVIRVEYRGGRLFLAVVRLMIGQLALVNFFGTGALQKELAAIAGTK